MRRGLFGGRSNEQGVDSFDPPPPGTAAPHAPEAMVDWSQPPGPRHERIADRPNPTRVINGIGVEVFPQTPIVAAPADWPITPPAALLDPPPAEIIANLDWIEITRGRGGPPVSAKARKRTLDKQALELMHAGEPFVYLGRRFPGANG